MEKELQILILEDLPSDAELAQKELKRVLKNYTVKVVDTKKGFVQALATFKPDIIISDYQLPTFDGLSALKITQDKSPFTPFVILTGSMNEDTAVECIKAGADDYVIKEHIKRLGPAVLNALENKKIELQRKQAEEKLKKTMDATIETVSKIVEVKDPYTAGHQQRVSQLTTAIAKELNLSPDKIEGIRVASLIHDIGKISVPTEILSKSTTLSDIEFSLIKEHSRIGYDILKPIDFSFPVAEIVLQHHERLDGSGYPRGLKGDEILLEAKIMGVVDVVEAMSSHRPYRPALGIDAALEEISKNKGILYDPEVVDICLRLFKEKGFKF